MTPRRSFDGTAAVRRLARRVGLDVRRFRPEGSATARRALLLERERVDVVLDVGANAGQYARELRLGGYGGRIVSFEPLAAPFADLSRNAQRDPAWETRQLALGDHEGEVALNVAADTQSSSLLNMTRRHATSASASPTVATEVVRVATLDAVAGEALAAGSRPFLKLDVQGYEDRVLDGAERTLAAVRGLEAELSLVELYEGQALIGPMLERLSKLGFACVGIEPEFVEPASGRVLQVNGLFARDDS